MVTRSRLQFLLLLAAFTAASPSRVSALERAPQPLQRRLRLVGELRVEGNGYTSSTAGSDYQSILFQEGGLARLYGYVIAPGLVSGWVEGGIFRVNRMGRLEGGGWRHQLGTQLTFFGLGRFPLTLYARTHLGTGVAASIPGGGLTTSQLGGRWTLNLPGIPLLLLQLDQTHFSLTGPPLSAAVAGGDQGQRYEGISRTAAAVIRHGEKGLHVNGRFELQQRLDLDGGAIRREQVRQTVSLRGDADLGDNAHWLIEGRADNYHHQYADREYAFGRFFARSYLRWRPSDADQGFAAYDFTGDGFDDYQSHTLQARHDHDLSDGLALVSGLRAQHFARHGLATETSYASLVAQGGARWQRPLGRWNLRVEDLVDLGAARAEPGSDGPIVANLLRADAGFTPGSGQRLSLQTEARLQYDGSALGASGASSALGARYSARVGAVHVGASGGWHYQHTVLRGGLGFTENSQALSAEANVGRAFGRWGSVAATVGHRVSLYDHGLGDFSQTHLTGTASLMPAPGLLLRGRLALTSTRFSGLVQDGVLAASELQWHWRQFILGGVLQITVDDAAGFERRYWSFLVRASRRFTVGG